MVLALSSLGLAGIASAQDAATASADAPPAALPPPRACDGAASLLDPSGERDVERARSEFVAGTEAVRDQRWGDAVDHFLASYQLSASPVALFNAALALRALNQHVAARDAFCEVLTPELAADAQTASDARQLAVQEAGRTATLEIRSAEPTEGLNVFLDGSPLEIEGLPHRTELDAEVRRTLSFEAAGYERLSMELTLEAGETRAVDPRLVWIPTENLAESPILWAIVAGVVVVGSGFIIWAVYEANQLSPTYPNAVRF